MHQKTQKSTLSHAIVILFQDEDVFINYTL